MSPSALTSAIVAHAPQQAVGDARRAARAARDLQRALVGVAHVEQLRRARDDARQLLRRVELQPRDDAEAVAQRVGQHAGARGGADQREGRQVELDRACRRTFADHDVDLEILQRRVEDFLDHRRQAVDLVDEQHIVRFEIGQDGGQVAGALQHRSRGLAQIDAHLVGDDMRQRGLAQARRAEQQHVVERFACACVAAAMKIDSCSRIFCWPTYSARRFGRRARSTASSCGLAATGEMRRSVSIIVNYLVSNRSRGKPDWRITDCSVPIRISAWSGIGTVRVPPSLRRCMTK